MTIPIIGTIVDPGLSLHVDSHLTLAAIVVTNTLPGSVKLTKRSATSVAKKDILHLFAVPDPNLSHIHLHHSRPFINPSHNNTNHIGPLMKLMIT